MLKQCFSMLVYELKFKTTSLPEHSSMLIPNSDIWHASSIQPMFGSVITIIERKKEQKRQYYYSFLQHGDYVASLREYIYILTFILCLLSLDAFLISMMMLTY